MIVSCNSFSPPTFVFVMHDDDGVPNAPLHVLLSAKEIADAQLVFLFYWKDIAN